MYDDGYHNNLNIDICDNVIDFMKSRNTERKGIEFQKMDVREMTYPDEYFDLIIDKSTSLATTILTKPILIKKKRNLLSNSCL